MVQCSRHVIPPVVEGRPHRPAGARSRRKAHGLASASADLPVARPQPHGSTPLSGGPPLASQRRAEFGPALGTARAGCTPGTSASTILQMRLSTPSAGQMTSSPKLEHGHAGRFSTASWGQVSPEIHPLARWVLTACQVRSGRPADARPFCVRGARRHRAGGVPCDPRHDLGPAVAPPPISSNALSPLPPRRSSRQVQSHTGMSRMTTESARRGLSAGSCRSRRDRARSNEAHGRVSAVSPASDMGPPRGEFRQRHGTTLSPVMGPPLSIHPRRRR